ncbi:3'-5' exonuclease [Cohnella thailandensis]|uniref:Exonuclease domain-containing protein n=1 Tax=Cohnella thailandensis TaxID=557557 RepID=A0A841SP76_9BACL|nr:3'-5' exonuclease [Cohnella thailandensis]MBB6632992.1 exonuclease domain-containing protein [Cohnella thailandensis]MBP1975313.1 inhibitor of KinA sporulation pathway (predicted exonuclease) [Cohnella thailandensis]
MDYIILDIEFNGRKFASELPMEVIEIGAVRLNSSLAYVDEFSSMIKPVYFAKLNSFLKKKTGIEQEEIDAADGFVQVSERFREWLGPNENFLLLTWGGEDMKRIVFDTRMHKLDDSYWMTTDYFDLLKGYLRYKGVSNDVSVEAALADLEIDASGSAHRALDDARMTAEVFRKVFGHLDLSLKQRFKDTYSNAKERRLVKNAIRMLKGQKLTPSWELLAEKVLAGKVDMTNEKKLAELREYFEAELNKKA